MTPHPQLEGREPLTREEILARALAIIDAEGLRALSMRRLASEFNVEAMALYYHFANKQAILAGVVDTAVIEATGGQPLPVSDDWRVTMRAGILAVRGALLAHPGVAPLITTQGAGGTSAAVWVEGPLAILHSTGLRGARLVTAYHQLVAYVLGWALLSSEADGIWSGGTAGERSAAREFAPITFEVGGALAEWDEGFEEGLDTILSGIQNAIAGSDAR